MKKFFIYTFAVVSLLSGLFVYVLYTEGAFDTLPDTSDVKPFSATTMKCEAGKCGGNKCGGEK